MSLKGTHKILEMSREELEVEEDKRMAELFATPGSSGESQKERPHEVAVRPASKPEKKSRVKWDVQSIMLAISLVIGLILSAAFSIWMREVIESTLEAVFLFFVIVLIICIPALFHKFVIGKCSGIKDYCKVAAHYIVFWGYPIVGYISLNNDESAWSSPFTIIVFVAGLLCYTLGAFLPK